MSGRGSFKLAGNQKKGILYEYDWLAGVAPPYGVEAGRHDADWLIVDCVVHHVAPHGPGDTQRGACGRNCVGQKYARNTTSCGSGSNLFIFLHLSPIVK